MLYNSVIAEGQWEVAGIGGSSNLRCLKETFVFQTDPKITEALPTRCLETCLNAIWGWLRYCGKQKIQIIALVFIFALSNGGAVEGVGNRFLHGVLMDMCKHILCVVSACLWNYSLLSEVMGSIPNHVIALFSFGQVTS